MRPQETCIRFGEFLGALRLQHGEATVLVLLVAVALIAMLPAGGAGDRNECVDVLNRGTVGRLDLNTATWYELELLPGIGEKKARDIVEYRKNAGPYLKLEDLGKVPGISSATVERLSPYLEVKAQRGWKR